MGHAALAVTDATFEQEIIKHDGLAMVDFWAEWCGPCKMIAPTIEALATEYAGSVKVAKMDVDANGLWAQKYNVRSIPTLLFFKGGQVVDQVVGALPKPAIEAKLKQHA
jgi:thioredoxin 1